MNELTRRNLMRAAIAACVLWPLTSAAQSTVAPAAKPEAKRESSVGRPLRIEELILPGTELEAKPLEDRDAKLVLRVISTYPHGTAFRYELEYYGLEPGAFDLRDYLRRKDASATTDLPPLPVTIVSVLPPGQILPTKLEAVSPPWIGGYVILMALAAFAWLVGLIALIFVGRKRKRIATNAAAHQLTLAERLQPLIESAVAGKLTLDQQATLERLLLGYWSERLGLAKVDPAEAMQRLRNHEQAGYILRQVEAWLHQPNGARDVDIAKILAPYRMSAAPASNARPVAAELVAEEVTR
jgi:hypothetical protein